MVCLGEGWSVELFADGRVRQVLHKKTGAAVWRLTVLRASVASSGGAPVTLGELATLVGAHEYALDSGRDVWLYGTADYAYDPPAREAVGWSDTIAGAVAGLGHTFSYKELPGFSTVSVP